MAYLRTHRTAQHTRHRPAATQLAAGALLPDAPLSVAGLVALARARAELAWGPQMHLSQARNAHFTNRPAEMAIALRGDYNSLEGDVRMAGGMPVMAHDPGATGGLAFADWARIAAESGRMVRIDLKEIVTLPHVLGIVEALGIPDHRLTFNLSVFNPLLPSNVDTGTLRALRRRHPGATIGLNVPFAFHNWISYRLLIHYAGVVGNPVMTALSASRVTPEAVRMLRPHMLVGVWNDPLRWSPADAAVAIAHLRAMGVDGMIDMRTLGGDFDRP